MKKGNGRKRKGSKPSKSARAAPRTEGRAAASGNTRSKPAGRPAGSVASSRNRQRTAVQAIAQRYSQDDRLSLALLLAPFMIVSAMLAGQHAMKATSNALDTPFIVPPPSPVVAAPPASLPPVTAEGPAKTPGATAPQEPLQTTRPERGERVLVRRPALPALATLAKPGESLAILNRPAAPATAILPPAAHPAEICEPMPDLATRAQRRLDASFPSGIGPGTFGRALALAAAAQLDDVVIYNPRYARVRFPNGDVSALYGVCTDVVVRAYRALGIDLQALVQQTRVGRGDTNIDHRRVEVLRKLFAKHGETLPISDVADDYMPGDIVTYYRPQNRVSTAHIAIVSDQRAPSGRLMILHNRGWGTQLEDALFVDKITGHYRYSGPSERPATAQAKPDGPRRQPTQTAAVSARAPADPTPASHRPGP